MSGKATGWVLKNGPKDRAERAVLVAVADAADVRGFSRPGLSRLITGSCYSRSQVKRILGHLVEHGWLAVESPGGAGRAQRATYRITGLTQEAHVDGPLSEPVRGPSEPVKGSISSSLGVHRTSPDQVKRASNNGSERTVDIEPPLTPHRQDRLIPDSVPPGGYALRLQAEERFERWWAVYPKRDGKRVGKAKCKQLWFKLTSADHMAAWTGVHHYAASGWRPKDPERWLRDRLWEDWQEPAASDRANGNGSSPPEPRNTAMRHPAHTGVDW